ncbi:LPD1 domain-containing protein [Alteromonas lipotrueiana]|uniref:LPD1 domain-containing protein n=1 Tax=Alteromonas lipotrueiana TaxID=2803815 RepID=UPI001C48F1E9|nr:LPD1 domain-containing protein [Alteromonas lipotrueiana]
MDLFVQAVVSAVAGTNGQIAGRMFVDPAHGYFVQTWSGNASQTAHPLNALLCCFFRIVDFYPDGACRSCLKTLIGADRGLKMYYYVTPQEMAAKAFEACIQDHFLKNAILVQGTKRSVEARLGIYPHGNLRTQVNQQLMK